MEAECKYRPGDIVVVCDELPVEEFNVNGQINKNRYENDPDVDPEMQKLCGQELVIEHAYFREFIPILGEEEGVLKLPTYKLVGNPFVWDERWLSFANNVQIDVEESDLFDVLNGD